MSRNQYSKLMEAVYADIDAARTKAVERLAEHQAPIEQVAAEINRKRREITHTLDEDAELVRRFPLPDVPRHQPFLSFGDRQELFLRPLSQIDADLRGGRRRRRLARGLWRLRLRNAWTRWRIWQWRVYRWLVIIASLLGLAWGLYSYRHELVALVQGIGGGA